VGAVGPVGLGRSVGAEQGPHAVGRRRQRGPVGAGGVDRGGGQQGERAHAVRVLDRDPLRDGGAHRHPDQVHAPEVQRIQDAERVQHQPTP
jgi:hypothetical protein